MLLLTVVALAPTIQFLALQEVRNRAGLTSPSPAGRCSLEPNGVEMSKPGDPLARRCSFDYVDSYEDLAGIRVIAVVFTGRGSRMRALLPYLRRDLRVHQGLLDRIIFALIRRTSASGMMQPLRCSQQTRRFLKRFLKPEHSGPDSLARTLIERMERLYAHHKGLIEVRDYTEPAWSDARRDSAWHARHRIPALYRSLNDTDTIYLKAGPVTCFLYAV